MLLPLRKNINFINRLVNARFNHQNKQHSPLYLLRQKTGLAYNLCREALNKHDNDVDKASAWLEAQAISLGLQKATKLQNRSAKQGLLGMSVSNDNKRVSILELNCETDFVAKNQVFKDFAIDIMQQLSVSKAVTESSQDGHIEISSPPQEDIDSIEAQIPPLMSKLGENIILSTAKNYRISGHNGYLFGQVHAQACSKEISDATIVAGRFGSIVGLLSQIERPDSRDLKHIGNRLCQHVIGYNPKYIELPVEVREHLEKEMAERKAKEEAAIAGESEISQDEDYSSDSDAEAPTNSRDDWPSMMDQTLIMSQDQNVRDYCKEQSISIIYFNRMECGQIQ